METQNDILLGDILLAIAEPLNLSEGIGINSDLLNIPAPSSDLKLDFSSLFAPAPLSPETDLKGEDKSDLKIKSDDKSLEKNDKSELKIVSDEKSPKDDDSDIKILSDDKSPENADPLNLSEGIESGIVKASSDEVILNVPDLFSPAPPPVQRPDSGNDRILSGDDNPNNLSDAGSFVTATIWGFGGNDTLTGGFNNDLLYGGAGDDLLNGGLGNDFLNGGDGNDSLDGGYGYDTLDGGNGTDTANYSFWWGGIKANLQTEVVSFFNDGNSGTERLISIENLVGSGGNDEIVGNSADNVLSGENGNDFLSGEDGNDVLLGGNGNDTLNGGNGFNQLNGGDGYDIVQVVGEGDILFNFGKSLNFNQEDVVEYGNNVAVLSNIEQVQIIGGNNDDFVLAIDASVAIKVEGKGGNDAILGGIFNDTLEGGAGDDLIRANDGDDILQGSDISNSVEKDTLLGGGGADTFVLATSNGSLYLGDGFATILDFKWWEGDTIKVAGSISDYRLDMTKNFSGNPALDTAIYRGNDLIAVVQDTTDVIPAFDFRFV
jgi:Ca2+-binding RTX toxin-like protein